MNILSLLTPKCNVEFLYLDFTLRQALEKMEVHRYTSIPLLDRNGIYIRTVTEGDILWHIKEQGIFNLEKAEEVPIKSVKGHLEYQAVHVTSSFEKLVKMALRQNFVPIVDDNSIFIGLITRQALIEHCLAEINKSSSQNPLMDVLTALDTRRSIRRFLPGTISEAQLQTILKAGLSAPSAHNRRPFHFVIISEEETKRTLQEKSVYGRMIMESALLIAVCGDTKIQPVHDFLIEDCSAATENILMAAHGNHLGAVWVGVYALGGWQRTIQEVLKLPENILPVALIPIGIPGEKPVFRNRFEKEKIHYQRW